MFPDRIIAGGSDRNIFDIGFADEYTTIGNREIIEASLPQILSVSIDSQLSTLP